MKPTVYLETTIVSYLTARPSGDLIAAARQTITYDWWQIRSRYDLYTSEVVVNEAAKGDPNAAQKRLDAIAGIPLLNVTSGAVVLGRQLVEAQVVPERYPEDALHLALAAAHGLDFLLTWNCKHIANANIRPKLLRTLDKADCSCPIICTPEELLGDEQP